MDLRHARTFVTVAELGTVSTWESFGGQGHLRQIQRQARDAIGRVFWIVTWRKAIVRRARLMPVTRLGGGSHDGACLKKNMRSTCSFLKIAKWIGALASPRCPAAQQAIR